MSITSMSLRDLCDAIKARELSAVEVVQAHLDRIAAVEQRVKAFISLDETALDQAKSIDQGGRMSLLAGIPAALKDNICVRGGRMTCGSRVLEEFVSPYSATVWERLKQAGSVLMGKTNLDEFGMGSTTAHSAFYPTHNPHDLARAPGGSSGGSAAAVAAGMVPLALGSDTGGSVRLPASHCGVVGMKPTYGAVSRYGLTAFASSLEQVGPMTRNVADNALALGVIAGHDPKDGTSVDHPGGFDALLGREPKGLRIGLLKEAFDGVLDGAVRQAVMHAASVLEKLGAEVVEVSLPSLSHALPAYYIISSAEASSNLARFDGIRYGYHAQEAGELDARYIRSRTEGFGEEVKRRILLGTYVLSEGYYDAFYQRALQVRTLVIRDFEHAFAQVDCLLSPVAPTAAPVLCRHREPLADYRGDIFTVPANIAGIPALAMPCGQNTEGMPIGVQLMGRAFAEPLLYQVGHALEAALGPVTREVNL